MKSTTEHLRQRQKAITEEMRQLQGMRRGVLSEQRYADRSRRKGGKGACGPYFIWQGYVNGKHFSKRVSSELVEQVRMQIEQGKRFLDLCQEYMALGETLAERELEQPTADEAEKKGLKSQRKYRRK